MSNKKDLLAVLKSLDEIITKEYSLNVEPRSYKGENSQDESLPADWQKKLEPISGGQGGEHAGDHGAEKKATKSGSQSDPYIHKQHGEYEKKADDEMEDEMNDEVEDVMDEEEDFVEPEGEEMVEEDEDVEKMGMYNSHDEDGEVVALLRDIKGFLEQATMMKQQAQDISELRKAITTLSKALPDQIDAQVKSGIQGGLKQFGGLSPSSGMMQRKKSARTVSKQAPAPAPVQPSVQARIGLEDPTNLVKANDQVTDHDMFVDAVDTLAGKNDTDDLRGSFRLLNKMREDSGQPLAHTLYYYKR